MGYIIAIMPIVTSLYIEEAQKQFGKISQDYLLSPKSLPHVTLASFDLNDENQNIIDALWQDIQSHITNIPTIRFLDFRLSRKFKIFWNISLTVARDTELVIIHQKTLEIRK